MENELYDDLYGSLENLLENFLEDCLENSRGLMEASRLSLTYSSSPQVHSQSSIGIRNALAGYLG